MTFYTQDHEWLVQDADIVTVGITQHAADALGDLVFVEVAAIGTSVEAGAAAATVESVKAASDIYAPVAGTIVAINTDAEGDPAIINTDPEGQGWLFKLKLANADDLAALMDRAAYDTLLANG